MTQALTILRAELVIDPWLATGLVLCALGLACSVRMWP